MMNVFDLRVNNEFRQIISQRFIARLASWRIENALIRKYHKSRNECTLEDIERAEALITKRNNRPKRKKKLQDESPSSSHASNVGHLTLPISTSTPTRHSDAFDDSPNCCVNAFRV